MTSRAEAEPLLPEVDDPDAAGACAESDAEQPLWEMSVTFYAADEAEADDVADRALVAICEGTGDGEDHECKRLFVASGPVLVTDEETELQRVKNLLDRAMENLRLMRQFDVMSKEEQVRVVVEGYGLFDEWNPNLRPAVES